MPARANLRSWSASWRSSTHRTCLRFSLVRSFVSTRNGMHVSGIFCVREKYAVSLLTKFTQTDEVFGPVSFSGMKNETYHRVIAKRLPDAEIAFLDEIWKSSSAILNAILKIVNERRFTNGTTVIDVPLMSIFAASN